MDIPSPALIYAGTGHRPDKLGGYSVEVFCCLADYAGSVLSQLKPSKVISGMAIGWDQALATAAYNLEIPFIAAVPFKGQELFWRKEQQEFYHELLTKAEEVVIVSPGAYSAAKMQVRNKWMVDHADRVVALWDGSSGGTANCIRYAKSQEKEIFNFWNGWNDIILSSMDKAVHHVL